MKKNIAALLGILMILAWPVAALCDNTMGTSIYVMTPRLANSANQSLCLDSGFTCLYNSTWMANGTLHTTNGGMTVNNCHARATETLTQYTTEAENLVWIDGSCSNGTFDATWTYGCAKAGIALEDEVDSIEENQATAETNQLNRTAFTVADIEANDDANLVTVQADISNRTATSIANDDANTVTLTTAITNTENSLNTSITNSELSLNTTVDDAQTAIELAITNTETNLNWTVTNSSAFLYDTLNAVNNSLWIKIDIVDEAVWSNSSLFCKIWGYITWPESISWCDERLISGTA